MLKNISHLPAIYKMICMSEPENVRQLLYVVIIIIRSSEWSTPSILITANGGPLKPMTKLRDWSTLSSLECSQGYNPNFNELINPTESSYSRLHLRDNIKFHYIILIIHALSKYDSIIYPTHPCHAMCFQGRQGNINYVLYDGMIVTYLKPSELIIRMSKSFSFNKYIHVKHHFGCIGLQWQWQWNK